MKLKRAAIAVIIALFVYLSLYSWNLRSGQLDRLSAFTGLEIVKWVLWPGEWVHDKSEAFWDEYIYLIGLKQLNDQLSSQNNLMRLEIMKLREKAAEADRFQKLLNISPVDGWTTDGARIIAHRMGPSAALDSVILGKGISSGILPDTPVMTSRGVLGRIVQPGLTASKAMLISDRNSRISVRGQLNRSAGLLIGNGEGEPLSVKYVKLNSAVNEGEILVTSGLAGIFPPGLPIAKVVSVERSDISLFLKIEAVPLADMKNTEEVLLLQQFNPVNATGANSNSTSIGTGNRTTALGE
ncbi:rod shape-determining protein MreC [Maridesulfovibrio zosterae]|uniref:rod shape-determining protein MreC n=1 Tax=Maridesulfovibrio zosterae TaxID=82171 RepID=UPI000408B87D|nr:rod shape-determining protein MreC [Maridesulfovibrio zosterae]